MEVEIEKIVHGGYGFARLAQGICLVPFAVPGDILDIECSPEDEVAFGWIKKIIRPSLYRKPSLCPVFGLCGGCDFDNMDYEYELNVKKNILIEDLTRLAEVTRVPDGMPVERVIYSMEYGYRNRAGFKVDSKGNIGFFRKKSHEVVPLPDNGCKLLQGEINGYVSEIRNKKKFKEGGFRIRADTKGNIYRKGVPDIEDDKFCYCYIKGIKFRINIDDFFQVNNFLTGKWVSQIELYLQPEKNDVIADLFCGSGLIALNLAKNVKSIIGIELNKNAVRSACYNADWNNIQNVSFVRGKAEQGISSISNVNKIILDPPRFGLQKSLITAIVKLSARVIVYASCDTATFSRDVKEFIKTGYLLEKITLVDMFPRTKHSEVVARIVKS